MLAGTRRLLFLPLWGRASGSASSATLACLLDDPSQSPLLTHTSGMVV